MTEKEHLECEIKELELEIEKHNEAIQNLNNIKERKTQKLKEMTELCPCDVILIGGTKYRRVVEEPTPKPPTLYEMFCEEHGQFINRDVICGIVERWLSRFGYDGVYGEYEQGYNDLLEDLKTDLK